MSKSLYDLIENDASVEEIKAAIAEGADVNEIKAYHPVLLLAVERKKGADVVRALLEAGAEVDRYITKDDLTDEDKETMEEEGTGLYECVGINQWTPLHSAIFDNDLEVAKLLLEAGADVNLKTGHDEFDTCTPLGRAHTKESIELLIEYGADVNQQFGSEGYDDEGNPDIQDIGTKLHWDLHRLDPECVLLLLRAGATTWDIDRYIKSHPEVDADVFRSLAEENNNSSQDDDWEDDEDWDFDNDSEDETEDEDEENDEEEEAKSRSLHDLIAHEADVEDIEAAIAAGADVNAKDADGDTPLHKAVWMSEGEEDIVRILLESGADVNVKNEDGKTPLHIALDDVAVEKSAIIIALIEAGADVNAKDEEGNTALHKVMELLVDQDEIVRILLESGADVNVKNSEGNTPMQVAEDNQVDSSIINILRAAGAK